MRTAHLYATVLLTVGSVSQMAEACVATYTDHDVNAAQTEVQAWAWVEDYFDSGYCFQEASQYWSYWEHSYEASINIQSPTQNSAYDIDTESNVTYGGGSASAFTLISAEGDPGEYCIDWVIWIWCTFGGFFVDLDFEQCICIIPPYLAPPLQSVPTPNYVSSLGFDAQGGTIMGLTTANIDDSALNCVQRCNVYRLEGDLVMDPFRIDVATTLPSRTEPGTANVCPANAVRPQQFVLNASNHEDIHADVFLSTFSPFRNNLGNTYGSLQACNNAAATISADAHTTLAATAAVETQQHPNHTGERRTLDLCVNPPTPTGEYWCGGTTPPALIPGACPGGDLY